ncbi:hypothetical protein ACEQPO_08815 [Bacillus sp. SL00103]
MIGVEVVDPNEKQDVDGSYPANPELASLIQKNCFDKGLIVETGAVFGSVIRFLPPLIMTEEQLEKLSLFLKRPCTMQSTKAPVDSLFINQSQLGRESLAALHTSIDSLLDKWKKDTEAL